MTPKLPETSPRTSPLTPSPRGQVGLLTPWESQINLRSPSGPGPPGDQVSAGCPHHQAPQPPRLLRPPQCPPSGQAGDGGSHLPAAGEPLRASPRAPQISGNIRGLNGWRPDSGVSPGTSAASGRGAVDGPLFGGLDLPAPPCLCFHGDQQQVPVFTATQRCPTLWPVSSQVAYTAQPQGWGRRGAGPPTPHHPQSSPTRRASSLQLWGRST